MSAYIKLSTFEYPRYQGDICLEYPEISDEFVCPNTYALVQESQPLNFNEETETVEQGTPIQINGIWTQTWFLRDLTSEELEAKRFWQQRLNGMRGLNDSGDIPNVIG
jgi:hypothetical protein